MAGDSGKVVVDYTALASAASQLDALQDEISTVNGVDTYDGYVPTAGGSVDATTLDPGSMGAELANLYLQWSGPLSDGSKQVQQLAATFRGVAQAFFNQDATQAAAVNAGMALSAARNYPSEYSAYQSSLNQWQNLQDPQGNPTPGVSYYYDAHGNLQHKDVPRPIPPVDPQGTFSGSAGVKTTYTENGTDAGSGIPLIGSETTTVSAAGMTYTETTTFGASKGDRDGEPVQDTTQSVHNADGSTDVITTTNNLDGSATTVDVNTTDGKTTTTTETKAGPDAPWVEQSS